MNLEEEPKMLAYHNDETIKTNILTQLQAHYDADEIIQGRYWEDGKGCAVGCTIHSDDHASYEPLFGIPRGLARLKDTIFESLPNGDAQQWPLRFMGAIAPGADLSRVWPKFVRRVLYSIALPNAGSDEAAEAAIRGTIDVFDNWIATGEGAENMASAANRVARRAAYSAAHSAAYSAASAAWSAADSTAYSAAYNAARRAAWSAMADKLIELLETAK